ncbi:MAG: glycosyltransferase family 4 protein [Chlamydiota bacterium]
MGTKLIVVYLIPSAEISGGTYVACEHAAGLAKRGHAVSIAVAQRGQERRIGWFPGIGVPVIGVDEIAPDTDVVVATWWETAYLAAKIPARARCYLVQALEPLFYGESRKTERFFSALTYRLGYPMITVAPWLAKRLEAETGREVCVVRNQLNPALFHPAAPIAPEAPAAMGTAAFVSLRARSGAAAEGQVYWDEGGGFCERSSSGFRMGPDWGERHIAIPDPAALKRIRIDAGNLPGNTVELSSIRIASLGGEMDLSDARRWRPNRDAAEFSSEGGVLRVRSSGGDPFIICALNEKICAGLKPVLPAKRFRILVEGPLGIEFKGVRRALEIARRTGAEVWFVEGKAERSVFEGVRPDRVFNRVPIDRMREIYSSCDLLLKLSRVESFAYPPLEMMACGGIPVVGDVEGIREYMTDGVNGFIVAPGDDEGALRALRRLMGDEGLRARIREGCRETVARESNWETQTDALERFLVEKAREAPRDCAGEIAAPVTGLVDCYIELMAQREAERVRGETHPPIPPPPRGLLAGIRSRIGRKRCAR